MNIEFEIKISDLSDRDSIIEFIRTDWSESHIFVKDPLFFDYFYQNSNRLNFIIGKNSSNNAIEGILGFQLYSMDPCEDIFLAIWKVRKGCKDTSLGLKLLEYLKKQFNPQNLHCLGINKKTINIYKFLDYQVGIMDHYCLLNPQVKKFQIASFDNLPVAGFNSQENQKCFQFESVKSANDIHKDYERIDFNYSPRKSKSLFIKKYINHPYYDYTIYRVSSKDQFIGFLVLRKVTVLDTSCIRIIDFLGELEAFPELVSEISFSLLTADVEYVDICVAGLSNEAMKDSSFINVSEIPKIIIPNYFEPFEKKRIDIYYFTSKKERYCFFKGDGDQDRPSIAKRN